MMLPSVLLSVIAKQGNIRPRYMFPNERAMALLSDLILLFKSARGRKRRELDALLKEFETGLDYKTVRGVAALLSRRCEFASNPPLDPIAVRKAVFHKASEVGVTMREERDWVVQRCAKEMQTEPEKIEASLWADMEDEQLLVSFRDIDPRDLLRAYNLALVQTLLFKARKMEVLVPEGCISIVSSAKRLGLMYRVERRGDSFWVEIEGPLSALKLCERYGTSMARLIPGIVSQPRWEVSASVAWKGERPSMFELSSAREGGLLAYHGDEGAGAGTGDASSEKEKLIPRLQSALPGWTVEEVSSPMTIEGATFLPDLKISKGGISIYLEMLGFWTEDYVRKRGASLLSKGGGEHGYLTFADRGMTCSMHGAKGTGVILYDKRSLVKEVVSAVEGFAEKHPSTEAIEGKSSMPETADRPSTDMPITGDVIDLRALARKHGTDEETIFRSLEPKGYIRLREMLVSRKAAERIAADIMRTESYLDASIMIRSAGIPYPDDLLRELGFAVIWHGLDPQNAMLKFVG
jgi:predicted nuclease of restriction endonuclease-like RecB superfamily